MFYSLNEDWVNIVCAAFALVLVNFHLIQPSGTGALAGEASQIAIWTPPFFYYMSTVEGGWVEVELEW